MKLQIVAKFAKHIFISKSGAPDNNTSPVPRFDDEDIARALMYWYRKATLEVEQFVKARGGTQEFELRSIKFKKYISGLRSIFWFSKEA